MKILIANLGSTSFKYRLFEMTGEGEESVLAQGGYERVTDHAEVIQEALQALVAEGHLASEDELDAVGFKTVLGQGLSGCVAADDRVLDALEGFAEIAPSHNPCYAEGIRLFRKRCPKAQLVALFETAFYQWVPEAAARYAVPDAWHEAGIRRYGFHGASHKFIAERSAALMGRDDVAARARKLYLTGPGEEPSAPLRVISCHLGGSSSVTGMCSGVAVGTSMGLSPQSGLPQNNRVGDLDAEALPLALKRLGIPVEEAQRQLTQESGLLGLSGGISNDLRDLRDAAAAGSAPAQLALDHLVWSIRRYIGSFLIELGGLDALVFTAGIAEYGPDIRAAVCADLEGLGLKIDPAKNEAARGIEAEISASDSAIKIWVIPTNEEWVVARETFRWVEANSE